MRTAIPFVSKYIVPAAKSVDHDLSGVAAPEIAEVVGDGKAFKEAAKSEGKQLL